MDWLFLKPRRIPSSLSLGHRKPLSAVSTSLRLSIPLALLPEPCSEQRSSFLGSNCTERIHELQVSNQYQAYLHFETLRVVRPYLGLGCVAILLALIFLRTSFPKLRDEVTQDSFEDGTASSNRFRLLKNRHLLFTVCAQFFYVGAQVGTWSYFIQYVQDYTGQPEKIAGYFLTGTLAMFGFGRFASSAIMKYVAPARLMGVYCLINILLLSARSSIRAGLASGPSS